MVIEILFFCIAVILASAMYDLRKWNNFVHRNVQFLKKIKETKRVIVTKLLARGCLLKNRRFVCPNCKLTCAPNFIYLEKQKILIFNNKICSPNIGYLEFEIYIYYAQNRHKISFKDFAKVGNSLFCETILGSFSIKISIFNNFTMSYKIDKNNYGKSCTNAITKEDLSNITIIMTLRAPNYALKHAKTSVKFGETKISYFCPQHFLKIATPHELSLMFECNKSQKINLMFKMALQNANATQDIANLLSIKFFAQKRQYLSSLVAKLNNNDLSNFANFSKVQKICQELNTDYENLVFFTLFSSLDYKTYKMILRHINLYKLFDKTPVFLYKNIYPKSKFAQNIKFVNYYSTQLNVVNFLLKNGHTDTPKICKLQSQKDTKYDNFFDLKTFNQYQFFDKNNCPNLVEYSNFRKIGNSLKLENSTNKKYYNFSSPFKINASKITFRDTCVCVIKSDKILKKSYYECLIDKAKNDEQKQLFINLWQEEKQLKNDIEESIALCPPVALIYAQDKMNFFALFEKFYAKYKDISSKLVMFYYLCKVVLQTQKDEQYLYKYHSEIIANAEKCFGLSKKCQDNSQKILLYLHIKNLRNLYSFQKIYSKLTFMGNSLSVENTLSKCANDGTFDELIKNYAPTLFNYEFLLDKLLTIKRGYFRFKSDICTYDNVFKLNYCGAHATIHLKGNKLSTMYSNLQINENLFIPLNLQGVCQNFKIS